MAGAVIYYVILFPISLLPLRLLYIFTDFFYLLLITCIPYRKEVVSQNIKNSFPLKSAKERKKIERKYYRHLCNLLAEGVKNLSISKKELKKRFTVSNPEIINDITKKGQNVLLVSGHLNNWEWLITGQNLLFDAQAVGIGMPLTSKFWDKKLNERRSRYGMHVIHSRIVNNFFQNNKENCATLTLFDQSPGDERKCYWMNFLNQETGIIFGPEILANKYNQAVVYFDIKCKKRGYYTMTLKEITTTPRDLSYGKITEKCTKLLEESIRKSPAQWLWSHKRWKKTPPKDLVELRKKQEEKFKEKYR